MGRKKSKGTRRKAGDPVDNCNARGTLTGPGASADIVPAWCRTFIANSWVAIGIFDLEENVVLVNERFGQELGYTPAELVGKNLGDFCDPDVYDKFRLESELRREGRSSEYEVTLICKDGQRRTFQATVSPFRGEDGAVVGAIGMMADVTEQKRSHERLLLAYDELEKRVEERTAELATANEEIRAEVEERKAAEKRFRRSEERYRQLFNSANDALYLFAITEEGLPGKFVDVNDAACRALGYTREELLALSPREIEPPEYAKMMPEIAQKIIAEGSAVFESVSLTKDGTTFPVELNVRYFELEGELTGLAIARDITERKRAEEALRGSRACLVEAERVGNMGSWDWNVVTKEVVWSDQIHRIFGLTPREFEPTYEAFLKIVHPEDRDFVVASVDDALEGGKEYSIDHRIVLPDGEVRVVHGQGEVTLDASGGPVRMLGTVRDITESKRAEEELRRTRDELELRVEERTAELTETLKKLRASEETHRKLVETAPDGVSTTDLDGVITYASPRAAELYGFDSADELVGRAAFEFVAPEDRERAAANFQKAVAEGAVRNLEFAFLRKDGGRFIGELSATLTKDAEGRPTGFIATTRDITGRRRAEAAMRESEEKYRGVVEQARDGIVIVQEGKLAFANRALADMVGYAGDELVGNEFLKIVPPRLHEAVAAQYERYEPGAEPARAYETCLLTRDGREVPVAATASQIQYEGRPAHLVFVYDLTERREQEKVVREQRWILENVLDNMSELVYVLDPDTYEILFMNETAEAALGKGLAGQPCYRAVWGLDAPCHGCEIERVFAGGGDETYTRKAFNEKLGRWLRVNVRPVPWLDGGQVCCAVATDVSESKALAEEIIAHNRALNQMVRERTAALEVKNRELESFAYSVSHDLRAPLRSIEGFSRAVLDDYREQLDEDGRDFLERIVSGAVRMDQLINDLLNYSRLGRSGVDYEVVDMNELVAVALGELDKNIKAAGARVEVAGSLPRVNGDRSMLLVLLNNLVGNAIKYRKADVTPEVKISCRGEGEKVVFAIEDNGIGLDMKFQDKVFEIFQRLHTEDEYPGTGIGLASAKKVVTAHGGRIWYESKPGVGTTFFFEVPGERSEGDSTGG